MAETSGRRAFALPPALDLARVRLAERRRLAMALLATAAAAVALIAALYYVRSPGVLSPVFDDSFISLLFARNLAEHGKLSFDGHTWSTGATSILHVSLLAVPLRLGVDPFNATIGLGVVCHVGLALATFWLGWAVFRGPVAAGAAAVLISLTNYAAFDAGNGMETSLFMALLAASMAAVLSARSPRGRLGAGGLIALAILARPEGALMLPATVTYQGLGRDLRREWRALLRELLPLVAPGLVVLAGLSLFAFAVTGELTPGTATAKLRFFQDDALALKRRLQIAGDFMGLFFGPLFPLIMAAFLAPRRREALLMALFWVPMVASYVWFFPGGLSHYFYRYQHPALPLLAVMAGGGVGWLFDQAMRRDIAVKALALAALVVLAVPVWEHFQTWRILYRDASFETLVDLEAMARDLNTIVRPDQTLATHDIGAVGYYANYRVLDLVGLVNPDVIKFHSGRRVSEYIDATRPDYLLIFPSWDADLLHIFPGDHPDRYELVKVYPGRNIRPDPYLLYRVKYPLAP